MLSNIARGGFEKSQKGQAASVTRQPCSVTSAKMRLGVAGSVPPHQLAAHSGMRVIGCSLITCVKPSCPRMRPENVAATGSGASTGAPDRYGGISAASKSSVPYRATYGSGASCAARRVASGSGRRQLRALAGSVWARKSSAVASSLIKSDHRIRR